MAALVPHVHPDIQAVIIARVGLGFTIWVALLVANDIRLIG
jgi:hypothetical protein